ncbi:Pr6Pr family membrane protein [Catalinimonas niigatensis]|uniref:Pr6Pr family membrane protein n=1 Tax=Catalinimonas niigatensis TaxID=1397264 RepID=UPI0026661821|nr:Pr6Pr family membrane protein [Catalinimonas niigatensis]WPP52934.1 Pr6Pr family membrane protein [Catalinimonas niigatensis]
MRTPQKSFIILGALLAWFAVIMQFVLMMENRVTPIPETIVRFFSFFTILTNTLIALYFTSMWLGRHTKLSQRFQRPGVVSAIAVYITVVGLVYQLVLRQIWEPQGLQKLVDELLHSVNPVYFVLYWYLYEEKAKLKWTLIPGWLIYPLLYLMYILIRGSFSGFYPYPFVNVAELGMRQVLLNSVGLMFVFIGFCALYIGIGKILTRTQKPQVFRSS